MPLKMIQGGWSTHEARWDTSTSNEPRLSRYDSRHTKKISLKEVFSFHSRTVLHMTRLPVEDCSNPMSSAQCHIMRNGKVQFILDVAILRDVI